jgi:hypothetical protein
LTTLSNLIKHKAQEIDIERFIPETGQIADVYIKFNNGVQWVVEYQRSNIPSAEILHRRELYKKARIHDIWIVGENVIKEDGMLLCSMLSVGQPLICEFLGAASLISLDSNNEEVAIYRGLCPQNSRSYTVDYVYKYKLEEICFNLWGEVFGIDDYTTREFDVKYKDFQSVMLSGLTQDIETLLPSNTPGFNFKIPVKSEDNELHFHHINISEDLKRFVPVELANLKLFTDLVKDPVTYNQHFQFLNVRGVYPSRWESLFKKEETTYVPLGEYPVTKGYSPRGT